MVVYSSMLVYIDIGAVLGISVSLCVLLKW